MTALQHFAQAHQTGLMVLVALMVCVALYHSRPKQVPETFAEANKDWARQQDLNEQKRQTNKWNNVGSPIHRRDA